MSDNHNAAPAPISAPQDENQLILERREKLKAIRQQQSPPKSPAA